jgi:hypothetical protein
MKNTKCKFCNISKNEIMEKGMISFLGLCGNCGKKEDF